MHGQASYRHERTMMSCPVDETADVRPQHREKPESLTNALCHDKPQCPLFDLKFVSHPDCDFKLKKYEPTNLEKLNKLNVFTELEFNLDADLVNKEDYLIDNNVPTNFCDE